MSCLVPLSRVGHSTSQSMPARLIISIYLYCNMVLSWYSLANFKNTARSGWAGEEVHDSSLDLPNLSPLCALHVNQASCNVVSLCCDSIPQSTFWIFLALERNMDWDMHWDTLVETFQPSDFVQAILWESTDRAALQDIFGGDLARVCRVRDAWPSYRWNSLPATLLMFFEAVLEQLQLVKLTTGTQRLSQCCLVCTVSEVRPDRSSSQNLWRGVLEVKRPTSEGMLSWNSM